MCLYASETGPSEIDLETIMLAIEMQQKPVACAVDWRDRAIMYASLGGKCIIRAQTHSIREVVIGRR
jgi:hypothetical protein